MLSNMHFLAVQRPGRSLCRSVPCLMSVSSVSRGAMAEVTDKLKEGEEAGTERKQSLCSERTDAPGDVLQLHPQPCVGR